MKRLSSNDSSSCPCCSSRCGAIGHASVPRNTPHRPAHRHRIRHPALGNRIPSCRLPGVRRRCDEFIRVGFCFGRLSWASFSLLGAGGFTPFASTMNIDSLEIAGGGEYTLGMEFRDAAGHQSVLSFTGSFFAQWWSGHGYASPVYLPPDHQGGPGGPPSGSFWLGGTRYNVQLGYGSGGPYYTQDADGNWGESWYAADPVPFWDGGYWREDSGSFYATVTPATPSRAHWSSLRSVSLVCGLAAVFFDVFPRHHYRLRQQQSQRLPSKRLDTLFQNMVRVESSESNFTF